MMNFVGVKIPHPTLGSSDFEIELVLSSMWTYIFTSTKLTRFSWEGAAGVILR